MHLTFIEIKFRWHQVAGKEQVLQAIVVEISCSNTTTIVYILLLNDIDAVCFLYGVIEFDPCLRRLQFLEKGILRVTGNEKNDDAQLQDSHVCR
jgi:hypothetical protein